MSVYGNNGGQIHRIYGLGLAHLLILMEHRRNLLVKKVKKVQKVSLGLSKPNRTKRMLNMPS